MSEKVKELLVFEEEVVFNVNVGCKSCGATVDEESK